jgi:hypothetical protein
MTALTEEGIKTIELRHMTIMPSIHIDSLKELGWSESPLSQITEMKPARQRKAPTTRTRKKTA